MFENLDLRDRKRIHIGTSGCCNNNCLFCCDRDLHNGSLSSSKLYLTLYGTPYLTLKGFMKESKKINSIDSILFTGGETILNKNLTSFIRLSKKLGYKNIGLQTNGRLLCYKSLLFND